MKPYLEIKCIKQARVDLCSMEGQWLPIFQLTLHIPMAAQRCHRNTLPGRLLKTAWFATWGLPKSYILYFSCLLEVWSLFSWTWDYLPAPQPTWRVRCEPLGSHGLNNSCHSECHGASLRDKGPLFYSKSLRTSAKFSLIITLHS